MKKFLSLITAFLCITSSVYAIEDIDTETLENDKAAQIIEMEDNKINVIVMKQPLNEKSNQKIILKRNWLGVYVQLNGKIKISPLTNQYELE